MLAFLFFGFAAGYGTAKTIKPKPELSASEAIGEMEHLFRETDFGAENTEDKEGMIEFTQYMKELAEISERAGLQ